MKKKNLIGLIVGSALMASAAFAAPDPNFHIYLAFGQSNMEGQGTIESQDKTVDPRFQMLSAIDNFKGRKLGTWNDAIPPLANNHGGLGPTDYFGRTLVEKLDPQIKVGVVVVAIAGCSIVAFDSPIDQSYLSTQAGWFKEIVNDYGGNPYQRLVDMALKATAIGLTRSRKSTTVWSGTSASTRTFRSLRARFHIKEAPRARTTTSGNFRNSPRTSTSCLPKVSTIWT